jgi:hypothetical protein
MVLAALVAAPCACERKGGSASAGTASNEDPTEKKVKPEDCKAWGAHGGDVFVASVKAAVASCPPKARDTVVSMFADRLVSIRGAAEGTCLLHAAQTYRASEAACFMAATDALSMRACHLSPMSNDQDDDWEGSLRSMHDNCAVVAPPRAPQPGAAPSSHPPADKGATTL